MLVEGKGVCGSTYILACVLGRGPAGSPWLPSARCSLDDSTQSAAGNETAVLGCRESLRADASSHTAMAVAREQDHKRRCLQRHAVAITASCSSHVVTALSNMEVLHLGAQKGEAGQCV